MKCDHENIRPVPEVDAEEMLTGRTQVVCQDCKLVLVDFDGTAHDGSRPMTLADLKAKGP